MAEWGLVFLYAELAPKGSVAYGEGHPIWGDLGKIGVNGEHNGFGFEAIWAPGKPKTEIALNISSREGGPAWDNDLFVRQIVWFRLAFILSMIMIVVGFAGAALVALSYNQDTNVDVAAAKA